MAPLSSPEFVGRITELSAIRAVLSSANAGIGGCVLIGGEAGIGKTRLLGEVVRWSEEDGSSVLTGRCMDLSGGSLPFGPVVEALGRLSRRLGNETLRDLVGPSYDDLARFIPLSGSQLPTAIQREQTDGTQGWLFGVLLTVLSRLGARKSTVLALEDLHWADRSTLDLVAFLARAAREDPLVVIGTYRSDEVSRRHPLNTMLAELDRARLALHVRLEGLSRSDMSTQLSAILGEPARDEVVDQVHRLSEGNAFYAEELLDSGFGSTGGIPARLRDLLMIRVEALPPLAWQAVRIVATAGRPVDHALLATLLSGDGAEQVSALVDAVDHHVLASVGGTERYDFRHALLREAVYQDLQPGERVELHGAIARALSADHTLAVDGGAAAAAAELAQHWLVAQDLSRALGSAVLAARLAAETHAYSAASTYFDQALALWDRVAEPESLTGSVQSEVFVEAAAAAGSGGDPGRSVELVRAAFRHVPEDSPVLTGTLYARLADWLWEAGEGQASVAANEEARRLLAAGGPSLEWTRVTAVDAGVLVTRGRFADAAHDAERALALARDLDSVELEGHACATTLGCTMVLRGQADEGGAVLLEAIRVSEAGGSLARLLRAHVLAVEALDVAGATSAAMSGLERGLDLLATLSSRHSRVVLAGDAFSHVLFRHGEWDRAKPIATGVAEARVWPGYTILARLSLARMACAAGQDDAAEDHLTRAQKVCEHEVDLQFVVALHLTQADLGLARRDVGRVRAAVNAGLDAVRGTDWSQLAVALCAMGLRAEADSLERSAAPASELDRTARAEGERLWGEIARIQEDCTLARVIYPETLVEAAVARGELTRLRGLSDPQCWREAADGWLSLQRPYPAAYTLWRGAEALIRAGNRKAAAAQLRVSHELAERLGAKRLDSEVKHLARRSRLPLVVAAPHHESGVAAELGLTSREREILPYLMDGQTNRQIARALFISEKTASVHVSNVIRKLGAANRSHAAALAHRLGLG